MIDYDATVHWHGCDVPREMVSCPGCGKLYGHHKTRYCQACEECSACCTCATPDHVIIDDTVAYKIMGVEE